MSALPCPTCSLDLDTVDCVVLEASWHRLMNRDIAVCPTCETVVYIVEEHIEDRDERWCGTVLDAYLHEEITDIAKDLGILPAKVVETFAEARKLFRKEAGCQDEQTDAIVWRVLRTVKEMGVSPLMVLGQIASMLHEELPLRRWFWDKWREDVRASHDAHRRKLAELRRRAAFAFPFAH